MGFDGRFTILALAITGLVVSGCAEVSLIAHGAKTLARKADDGTSTRSSSQAGGTYKVGKPYQVDGIWYYPKENPDYDETGIASWYGEPFHGRRTANGETYDMNQVTAAHKTLPLPTMVRVTNLDNGRSLVVRVNDRGPFVHGRIIDLSRRSAQLLGFQRKGTAKIRVQAIGDDGSGGRRIAKPDTPLEERNAAAAAPQTGVQAESLPPPQGAEQAPATPTRRLPQPISNTSDPVRIASADPAAGSSSVIQQPVAPTRIYIQAGAFVKYDSANRLGANLVGIGPTKVTHALVNGQDFYRVRIGPLTSVEEADSVLAKVIGTGYNDARIIVD